jgi:hypothetical protein
MSTALTIPSYARAVVVNGTKTALTDAASGGVGGKAEFGHISIKQSRWRIIDVEGDEKVLETFAIPFAVVSINPSVSKAWYANKYQPGDEPSAPDCYSNNGIAPFPDADKIQSQQCATCDKNVWGSDVNPNNGNKLKACKDAKHIGIMFLTPDNLEAEEPTIYAQRLSAMSMINFSNFAKDVAAQGGALDYIVIKAEFDSDADYPLIKYSVIRNMTEDEFNVVDKVRNSERAVRVANADQKVIPIAAERVNHVQGLLAAPTGEMAQAEVDAARAAEKAETERKARIAKAHAEAAEQDKLRQAARAKELAAAAPAEPTAAQIKAKKLAEARAAFEAAQADLLGADDPSVGADPDATNVTKITDVEAKPRQRSPVNVVKPEAASSQIDDMLAEAMKPLARRPGATE